MNIKYNMLAQEHLPSEYLHFIITPKNDLLFFVLDLVSWLLIFLLPGKLSLSVCFPVWWLLMDSRRTGWMI